MRTFKLPAAIVIIASLFNFSLGMIQSSNGCGRGIFDILFFNESCSNTWFLQDLVFFGSAMLVLLIRELSRINRAQKLLDNVQKTESNAEPVARYQINSPRRPQEICKATAENAIEGEWIEASKS